MKPVGGMKGVELGEWRHEILRMEDGVIGDNPVESSSEQCAML